jgi:hypothetical protein
MARHFKSAPSKVKSRFRNPLIHGPEVRAKKGMRLTDHIHPDGLPKRIHWLRLKAAAREAGNRFA